MILDGVYQVQGELGRGGMGAVLRARHLRLQRDVAVKVILQQEADSPAAADAALRFRREVEVCARLQHPNIVRILDFGEFQGRLYYAMELLDASDLNHWISEGAMPAPEVRAWLAQAADALAYIHAQRLVHRDIKPANLMLSKSGVLTVMDFGLVRALDRTRLTDDGQLVGTARFLAPETLMSEEITPAIDVYALGLTAWEALAGRRTYTGNAGKELYSWVVRTGPVPLAQVCPDAPPALTSLIDRMCSRDPAARPLAVEVLAALSPDRVTVDASQERRSRRVRRITARTAAVSVTPPPPTRRSPTLVGAMAGLSVLVVLGLHHFTSSPTSTLTPTPTSSRAASTLTAPLGIVPPLSPGYHFSTISVLSDFPGRVSLETASATYARPTSDTLVVSEPELSRMRGSSPWVPVVTPALPPRLAHRIQLPWTDTDATFRLVRVTLAGTTSQLVLRDRRMQRATYETFRQLSAQVRAKGSAVVEASLGGWNGPIHFYPDAQSYCEPPLELSPWIPRDDFEFQIMQTAVARPDRESAAALIRVYHEKIQKGRDKGFLRAALEAFTFFESPDLIDQVWDVLDPDLDAWNTPAGHRCVAALCVIDPRVRDAVRAMQADPGTRGDAARAAWRQSGL